MKILYTSDIHAHTSLLSMLVSAVATENPDALIIGGDIVPHHLPDERASGILEAQSAYLETTFIPAIYDLKRRQSIAIYIDLANDDFISGRKILEKQDGDLFFLLHNRQHKLTRNVDIIGYMVVPPTPFQRKDWEKPDATQFPYPPKNRIAVHGCISEDNRLKDVTLDLTSDDTIENDLLVLEKTIDKPFILVSHSPPYQTPLDVIGSGVHVGSLAIRNFIEKWSDRGLLIASLHGHIHESPVRSGSIHTRLGRAICINPGQYIGMETRLRYVILELDESTASPEVRILSESL